MKRFIIAIIVLASGCITQEAVVIGGRTQTTTKGIPYKIKDVTLRFNQLRAGSRIESDVKKYEVLDRKLRSLEDGNAIGILKIKVDQDYSEDLGFWLGMENLIAGCTLLIIPAYTCEVNKFSFKIYCDHGLVWSDAITINIDRSSSWFPFPLMCSGNGESFHKFDFAGRDDGVYIDRWVVSRNAFIADELARKIAHVLTSENFAKAYKAQMPSKMPPKTQPPEVSHADKAEQRKQMLFNAMREQSECNSNLKGEGK